MEKSAAAGVMALAAVKRKKRGNLGGGGSLREQLYGKRFLRADFAAIGGVDYLPTICRRNYIKQ